MNVFSCTPAYRSLPHPDIRSGYTPLLHALRRTRVHVVEVLLTDWSVEILFVFAWKVIYFAPPNVGRVIITLPGTDFSTPDGEEPSMSLRNFNNGIAARRENFTVVFRQSAPTSEKAGYDGITKFYDVEEARLAFRGRSALPFALPKQSLCSVVYDRLREHIDRSDIVANVLLC